MTDIQIDAGTLLFSGEDLTATGLLIPFNEECRSNLGRFSVSADSFTIPTDMTGMSLNVEHARENVVGGFTGVNQQDTGIFGSYKFADTKEGRAAYKEAKEGKRKHLSAEVAGVVVKAGKAIAGKLFAAALVEKPAFPSATLLAAAVDTEEEPPAEDAAGPKTTTEKLVDEFTDEDGVKHKRTKTIVTIVDGDTTTIKETTVIEEPDPETEKEKEPEVATVIPNTLNASQSNGSTPITLREIGAMLFAQKSGQLSISEIEDRLKGQTVSQDTLFAALSDVKYDGTGGLGSTMGVVPQWIGEVWSATNYRQQVLPLFSHADLTSLNFNGFKWTTKPTGGDWAGNKAAVLSNTLVVAPVTGSASRYALGHDIAREFVDFPVAGFFESYAAAVGEDYSKWADTKVSTAVLAGATALAGDALSTLPGATGGTIGSAASAIIDGATAIITAGSLPSFALVSVALWKQMAKQPMSNVLGYLNASLGLSEGDLEGFVIRPSAAVPATKVLVGAKQAATVYELPGAPIRIDALDLAKGGVDKAAFGYAGVVINDAVGLQLVTAATAV